MTIYGWTLGDYLRFLDSVEVPEHSDFYINLKIPEWFKGPKGQGIQGLSERLRNYNWNI